MRLSDKLYQMQMGGYNPFNHLINIPVSVGMGYGQGIGLGQGLGFNENSQKQLGRMSALNNGLNSTAGFINSVSRRNEERQRLEQERDQNYYNTPQDRYRYADYSNSPRQASFFQNGGQIPVSNAGLHEYPNQPVMVPSNNITMNGINHDVLAVPDNDPPIVMKPNKQYTFANSSRVIEYPVL